MPTQIMSNGEDIPLPKLRKQWRVEAVLTQYASRCERQFSLTRRVFFQTLRGMIATILTIRCRCAAHVHREVVLRRIAAG
jgi:hypothetical protein